MIVLRGLVILEEEGKYSFTPFTEGLAEEQSLDQLVDDPSGRTSHSLYKALKPHEGKDVSIRFPKGSDGTVYGDEEAILKEVTPHFVKLFKPATTIDFGRILGKYIEKPPSSGPPFELPGPLTIPEVRKSVALDFLKLEEDEEKKRLRLVMDYSHWNPDL